MASGLVHFADQLRALALAGGRVLLTGPMDPDGDSLGACLALARGLRACGAEVAVAGSAGWRYALLPDADTLLPDAAVEGAWGLVVVLDGDRHRLEPPVARAFATARARALLDHHRSNDAQGYDLAWVDAGAPSTTWLVQAILDHWGVPIGREIATLLYTGLLFDTGGFRHSNTTPAALRAASELLACGVDHAALALRVLAERRRGGLRLLAGVLGRATLEGPLAHTTVSLADLAEAGATREDVEGIVDTLLATDGVELACLVIEKEPGRCKISLRSRAVVDVAALAARLWPGGGGHARAAGGSALGTVEQVAAAALPGLRAAVGG